MENLSKYLEDRNFILWVFQPDAGLEAWWSQFGVAHPEEKRNILLARKVLLKLHTNPKELSEEEKILLFSKVLRQIEEKQRKHESRKPVFSLLKYAAVALLFFSIGALLFYKQNKFSPELNLFTLSEPVPEGSAKLIRANGDNILLKENRSVLKYQADGELVINNDTLRAEQPVRAGETAMNQLIIPYGKTSELFLPDGSKVILNAGSRLVYPENFNGKTREVYLAGEAFFEVNHDKNHPFVVQVGDERIKVLGTKFNVSAYPSDNIVETVLAEGKVSLEKSDAGLFETGTELLPNQLASFDRTSKEINVRTVDTDHYIMWTVGMLKFESADLSRIVKRLERYYNIRFKFSDPLLGGVRISGKLQLKEDRDEILGRLATAATVKIVKKSEDLYEIAK